MRRQYSPYGVTCKHIIQIEETHIVYGASVLSVERRNGTCGQCLGIANENMRFLPSVVSNLTCFVGCNETRKAMPLLQNLTHNQPFDRVGTTHCWYKHCHPLLLYCVGATTKCYTDSRMVCVQRQATGMHICTLSSFICNVLNGMSLRKPETHKLDININVVEIHLKYHSNSFS